MAQSMLNRILGVLVQLPEDQHRTAFELLRMLRDPTYYAVIDRVVRKENPWPDEVSVAAKPGRYTEESVPSTRAYGMGYDRPYRIDGQLRVLQEHFPGLESCDMTISSNQVPAGAEGWFAIPRWDRLGPTYNVAVERVLKVLESTHEGKFENIHHGQLGPSRLRERPKKSALLTTLRQQQGDHDVTVIAAQFGIQHRGKSTRCANATMGENEFGLGIFEVAIMLLTHPGRLGRIESLWIDCAGDESSEYGDHSFEKAPCVKYDLGVLQVQTRPHNFAVRANGTASSFLPQ
jgi:hypothetical protein